MNRSECREKIDAIDAKIVALLEERMGVCEQIGILKMQEGSAILDTKREEEKIASIKAETSNADYRDYMGNIYMKIMEQSRELQKNVIEKCDK